MTSLLVPKWANDPPATNLCTRHKSLHAMRTPLPSSLQVFSVRLARKLLPACDWNLANAKREVKWLTEHVLQHQKTQGGSATLSKLQRQTLEGFVHDRVVKHKPLQYILGTQPFCDLDIITEPPVLIPRWETEEWTFRLITLLTPYILSRNSHTTSTIPRSHSLPFRILDLCTGTGCIALSLSSHLPPQSCFIDALDISPVALALSRLNLQTHSFRLHNPVRFHLADMTLSPTLPLQSYDLVVSNPPYIPPSEYALLAPDVALWEDPRALVAGEEGTAFHRRIARLAAKEMLREVGTEEGPPKVAMEIGGGHQVEAVTSALKEEGFRKVEVWKDGAERERCVIAW